MSAPTVIRDLVVAHTRMLKLPGVARTFESLARQARDSHWSHEDYLHEVLRAEEASRHESVMRQRLHEAGDVAGSGGPESSEDGTRLVVVYIGVLR